MAAELDKLAKYYIEKGNKSRAKLYAALAEEERSLKGPETVVSAKQAAVAKGETQIPEPDLRQQTYELLKQVREPSPEEKRDLKEMGFVFLTALPKSFAQVVSEDQDYFWEGELKYAIARAELRDYVPPAITVALNPTRLAIPGSFNKSKDKQLGMIAKYSRDEIEAKFPDAKAVMLPATTYAQADMAYSKVNNGQVLFRDFFARALDNTSEVCSAYVGQYHPGSRFFVYDWDAAHGDDYVGAVPAVVFLRK